MRTFRKADERVSSAKHYHADVWLYLKGVLDGLLAGDTDYSKFLPDV